MQRKTAIIASVAAGATAVALFAAPAIANGSVGNGLGQGIGNGFGMFGRGAGNTSCPMRNDSDDTTSSTTGRGYGMGAGMMAGRGGMMGQGAGRGMMGGLANLPAKGTMTTEQKATLAALAEEEKLAHDTYVALGAKYPDAYQFSMISRSETMHLSALRTLMTRYGVTDLTAGKAAGVFTSSDVQALYDSLVAGATDQTKALAAGVTIEKRDIADLTSALKGLSAPDAVQVYTSLQTMSNRHLQAFGG